MDYDYEFFKDKGNEKSETAFEGTVGTSRYDVFLSFSNYDSGFARQLVSMLETYGYVCCYPDRDFVPGMLILDNINNCISSSRVFLAILSDSYLDSIWCEYETDVALMKCLSDGTVERIFHIIPVILNNCKIPAKLKPIKPIIVQNIQHTEWLTTLKKSLSTLIGNTYDEQKRDKNLSPEIKGLPQEILNMDAMSIAVYVTIMRQAKIKVYNITIMMVGPVGAGKTVVTKRIMKKRVDIESRESTQSVNLHISGCVIQVPGGQWIVCKERVSTVSSFERKIGELLYNSTNDNVSVRRVIDTEITEPETVLYSREQHALSDIIRQTSAERPNPRTSEESKTNDASLVTLRKVVELCRKQDSGFEQKYANVNILDFAGQFIYYTTHQIFFSPRAIYVAVLDITKRMDDDVEDLQIVIDFHAGKRMKYKDYLIYWLNSIYTYARNAPVILLATHVDKFEGDIKKYFLDIRKLLAQECNHVLQLLQHEDIAIDNTIGVATDKQLEDLKQIVYESAKCQSYWGEEIPASWLALQNSISERKGKERIMSIDDVKSLACGLDVPIKEPMELYLFLTVQHALGNMIFFDELNLRHMVMIDPHFIIDAFKCIVTSQQDCIDNPDMLCPWVRFKKTARLSHKLLDFLWRKEERKEFCLYKNYLLELMKRLDIIATPTIYDDAGTETLDFYFVPSMLDDPIPKEALSRLTKSYSATSILCYKLDINFMPPPVFHCLIAALMNTYWIARQNDNLLVYCGCVVFDLQEHGCHKLMVSFVNNMIQVQIFRIGKNTPTTEVCIQTRHFVGRKIQSYLGLHQKSTIEEINLHKMLYIKCGESTLTSKEGCLPVSQLLDCPSICCTNHQDIDHEVDSKDLLKFWFPDADDSKTATGAQRDVSFGKIPSLPHDKKCHVLLLSHNCEADKEIIVNIGKMLEDVGYSCICNGDIITRTTFKEKDIETTLSECMMVVILTSKELNESNFGLNFDRFMKIVEQKGLTLIPLVLDITVLPRSLDHITYLKINKIPDDWCFARLLTSVRNGIKTYCEEIYPDYTRSRRYVDWTKAKQEQKSDVIFDSLSLERQTENSKTNIPKLDSTSVSMDTKGPSSGEDERSSQLLVPEMESDDRIVAMDIPTDQMLHDNSNLCLPATTSQSHPETIQQFISMAATKKESLHLHLDLRGATGPIQLGAGNMIIGKTETRSNDSSEGSDDDEDQE